MLTSLESVSVTFSYSFATTIFSKLVQAKFILLAKVWELMLLDRLAHSTSKATGTLLGHITGTDAAGPLFQGTAVSKRLDSSDAAFVDSIHTNDGGYGYSGAFAHADFFINGGKAPQPGCDGTETFCSHNMAVAYYAKSIINRSIPAISRSDSSTISWGEYAPTTARGSYEVTTS